MNNVNHQGLVRKTNNYVSLSDHIRLPNDPEYVARNESLADSGSTQETDKSSTKKASK